MSFLDGYLYLRRQYGGVLEAYASAGEIFNNGRTVDNMVAARAAGTLPQTIRIEGIGCECAAYDYNPLGSARASLGGWDDGTAAAKEFLGPYVIMQTGMDGAHNARDVLPRASFPYGVNLSPLKPGQRVFTFTVRMVATTHQGLDWGFDWLESELLTHGCSTCTQSSAWMRSACPRAGNMLEYVWEFLDVGLAEGPTWDEPFDSPAAAYTRDLTVTLFAGDPCRWGVPETCLNNGSLGTTAQCCTFVSQGRNAHVPVVLIQTTAGGAGTTTATGLNIDIWDANAVTGCSTFAGGTSALSQINVLPLPQGSFFWIDGRLRRALISVDGGVTYEDGSRYIDSAAGFIDWDAYTCRRNDDSVKIILKTDTAPALAMSGYVYTYRRAGC